MELIYSGDEVKRLLNESIPGYKPVVGNNSEKESAKINKDGVKDIISSTKTNVKGQDFKPVKPSEQSTDLGNNKNMLDLEFDYEPGKEYKERVKKQVTGEDSDFGNSPTDADTNKGNKAFYDAAKKAAQKFIDNKHITQSTGLVSKYAPVPKKQTPFKEDDSFKKTKRLNFKNTTFLNEGHMLSLVPEDYKKSGNQFFMKDKSGNEYLIEWSVNEKEKISEGIIVKYENKNKLKEEFDKIKKLYDYKSSEQSGILTNTERKKEESIISENIKKLKILNDN